MKTFVIILFICGLTECLRIGDKCEVAKKTGICKNIRQCPVALANWRQKEIYPEFCDTVTRVVCCLPEASAITIDRKSAIKCRQYSDMLFKSDVNPYQIGVPSRISGRNKCGHKAVPLVVGGEVAGDREFPHMCLIGFAESQNDFEFGCAGSLISQRFVLSCAHCAYNRELREAKYAKLGEVTRGIGNQNTYVHEIIQRIKHPNYSVKSIDHDIALFKLDRNVMFNEYVIPLCLPQKEENTKQAIATGWGDVGYGESSSVKLLKVTLELFGQEECHAQYSGDGITKNGIDYKTKVCAGSYTQRKDTCSGDSGGPLQIYNLDGVACMYTIIGITSFGQTNCGAPGVPGVYTRVYHYIDWIEGIVWA